MPTRKTEPVLGTGINIDEGVIIGYPTGRKIHNRDVVIGDKARMRTGTIIYEGVRIGHNFETGHNTIVREENIIGDNVSIWSNTVIDYGCRIGNGSKIHCNVYIPQYTVIEDDVFIAPGTSFANDIHPGCDRYADCMRGPTLGTGAQIGLNVTILPKISIGEKVLIGAGTVVTRDIPPFAVVCGNPGKIVGDVRELQCKSGLKSNPYDWL